MSHFERTQLPTQAQIAAISDHEVLKALGSDIERACVKIETDLEFEAGDNAWAARARSALAHHRYTERLVARRISKLRRKGEILPPPKVGAVRPDDACDPLTIETIHTRPAVDIEAVDTTERVDELLAWLAKRIDAVERDREDEIGLPAVRRDERFLAATGSVLREMRLLRQQLHSRRGAITRAAKKIQAAAAKPETREQLFIDAAREVLDRATYLRLWGMVDQREEAQA